MRFPWRPHGAAVFGFVGLLCGCPNPNLYTTPRTLPPGAVQVQAAPEFIGVAYKTGDIATTGNGTTSTTYQTQSGYLPMLPSLGVRVGLVDGLEVGARLQNFDSLAADLKVRLSKGVFDLAVDPGLQGFYVNIGGSGIGVAYLHLPVLLGLNVAPAVSLVASPGLVYVLETASAGSASGVEGSTTATGLLARLGGGVSFRVLKQLSIEPELTFMKGFSDSDVLVWVFGVGFNIGAQPDYSDIGWEPKGR